MLRSYSDPNLRSPILLCACSGWPDAASAASGALRYLLLKREARRIAEFDPDTIYKYTTTRPLTVSDGMGGRRLQWPELPWFAMEIPEAKQDLVILLGQEPDLLWRECIQSIGEYAVRLGVSRVVTFGGFLAHVHFAAPPTMTGGSHDLQMRATLRSLGIQEGDYQGPTGFVTPVLREMADRGIPGASLWIAAPNYLANTSNPRLSAALLHAAEQLLGIDLWVQELDTAGHDMERRIEDALRARPDLASFLRRLSGEAESEDKPESGQEEEAESELPSAEEVLRDLEEHLRRLKGEGDGGAGTTQ
ncbi:MAG TPA: PAC2 family protein [Chloroflexota bacterium]|nr:PAC2 family protein [Chloroflexota bacterium]